MKKRLPLIMAVLLIAGCTSIHRLDGTKYQTISVPQGLRDTNRLAGMIQRLTNGIPVIFKLTSGERMPLKLAVDLPMGELEKGDCGFAVKRDTYVLFSQKACWFSPDGQRWASIADPKAVAKLFGAKHEQVALGFCAGTNDSPFMQVEIKVK
jgi:hypothetical protein